MVSKSNVLSRLLPICCRFNALVVMAVYFGVCHFYPGLRAYWRAFLWLLGGTVGFHMALTGYALKMDQPDLKAAGKFLSAVIIFLGNTVSIVFLLGILFPRTVSWKQFARASGQGTLQAVKQVTDGARVVWAKASTHVSQN